MHADAPAPINRQVEPRTDPLTALRFSRFQEPGGWERGVEGERAHPALHHGSTPNRLIRCRVLMS